MMLQVQQFTNVFLIFPSNFLMKRVFLFNTTFVMEILDLISRDILTGELKRLLLLLLLLLLLNIL